MACQEPPLTLIYNVGQSVWRLIERPQADRLTTRLNLVTE